MSLRADILFRQNKFQDYVQSATEVLHIYEKASDQGNAMWMNIKIVVALALSCQLNRAYGLATENEAQIQETNSVLAQQYNNIARIVFRRIWNEKPEQLISDVKKWIDEHQAGTELEALLALALSVECNEEFDFEQK